MSEMVYEEIEISTKLYKRLQTHAKAEGITVEQFIDKLIHLALKQPGNKQQT